VDDHRWLAERFEAHRPNLRAVANRMLGSVSEADDVVQEAWLRLARSDARRIDNLGGWLTTVVGRLCLDVLRARGSRREQPLSEPPVVAAGTDPEQEALLADSVGLALLVVLETLTPAERLAFVLHDMFAIPFEEIAAILDRSPSAAKMLASRARRRVRGAPTPEADLAAQRTVVEAFLAAARRGDFDALLAVLDPDVTVRADGAAVPVGAPRTITGAPAVARQALTFSRRAPHARPALVNGTIGIAVEPRGRLTVVMTFRFSGDKITNIDVVADPERLHRLQLTADPAQRAD
jgi:RNA polymerase sigma-70 factor (ECF subfamily)